MTSPADLDHLDAEQLRALAARLMAEMHAKQTLIDKLTHEMAMLSETLVQAPVAPHIIDKGIPTAGLLAHVLVAKYADHRVLRTQPP